MSKRRSAAWHQPSVGNSKPDSFDHPSLRETIRLAQQGDAAAFEAIYKLNSGRVYALCLRMLHDAVEAEDLAQEVFIQVFRKLNIFRGESAFSTWLHRVAVNLVLMHLRRKSPPTVSIDVTDGQDNEIAPPTMDVGAPDLLLEGSIDRLRLERCIEQLPAGYRAIFVLHDIQGYQHDEIAEIVGCSIGNSKSQLHKARMRLRELLHEVRREKARNERMASRKLRSRDGKYAPVFDQEPLSSRRHIDTSGRSTVIRDTGRHVHRASGTAEYRWAETILPTPKLRPGLPPVV